jgi:uroporphyrinogen-III synthase
MIEVQPLPLTATTIVVTRPAHQAGPLCRLIEAQGGRAISFPALEIECSSQPQPLLQQLGQFDLAIFISANAVECAARFMPTPLPPKTLLAAVGKRTAALLQHHHHGAPVLSPANGSDSEALLAMAELQQVRGKRILIVRGAGGRELLAEALLQRGAQVEYAEVYRRVRPGGDLAPLQNHGQIDLITATSNESLQNLYDMSTAPQRDWLLTLPLVVIGQRGAELAQRLGFHHPAIIADEASDAGLLQAMLDWRRQQPNH